MTYSFATASVGNLLEVRISGERPALDIDNFNELWEFWSGAALRCRAENLQRVLIVSTAGGSITSSAAVGFYSRLEDVGFEQDMRIAVVIADAKARRVIELGVAIASDRGWNVKLFASEPDAVCWL